MCANCKTATRSDSIDLTTAAPMLPLVTLQPKSRLAKPPPTRELFSTSMDPPTDCFIGTAASLANGMTKKCRVCGDRALAFNFNGLSCESCKAFFRRNCLKSELICLQGGTCEINMSSRKFCPRCRLEKCFLIGMRKELVMAREEKSKRRRQPKTASCDEQMDSGQDNTSSSSDEKFEDISQTFDLGTFEQACFDEIKRANSVFLNKPYCALKLTDEANIQQALKMQETYIKKIIQFCKSLNAFAVLKSSDQLTMIKGFFEDSLTLRCAYNYDFNRDGFAVRTDEAAESAILLVRLDFIFPPNKQANLDTYRKFIYALHNEIENDKNIRDLLITISLFKKKPDLSCPEFVQYNFVFYNRLLLRYLQMKYQDSEKAEIKYSQLVAFIERMSQIKELIYETYMDIDVSVLSQVLGEIYHHSRAKATTKDS